ncbi:MAG TPA: thioredoxin domain-containing protein [Caulobacteraceae bacterium]|jgi:protein-disulfide isomerase|nr:thioredoxin domain-containing protein [Caulobacteraceae bacterium]
MSPRILFAAAALAALSLGGCQKDDPGFDAKVKAYLMAHPDQLRAAIDNMQAKEEAAEEAAADQKARAALPALHNALERDPRDFVANPNGKVTVAEFYDYRCPHCINIAPKVVGLIRSHPDVRFVFKEMPIFGATSEHAARAAFAAKQQGKDYVGLYEAFMADHALDDAAVDKIAASKGVNIALMNAPATQAADAQQLSDISDLFKALGFEGTPGFVVGDQFIRGEDFDGLQAAINKAEGKHAG